MTSDDVNLVTLSNSFAALKDDNSVLKRVDTNPTCQKEDMRKRNGLGMNTENTKVNDLVNDDSESDVDEVFNEMKNFITSDPMANKASTSGTGGEKSSLHEQWKETYEEDPYDDVDFDSLGLTEDQMAYGNTFDINLSDQIR